MSKQRLEVISPLLKILTLKKTNETVFTKLLFCLDTLVVGGLMKLIQKTGKVFC